MHESGSERGGARALTSSSLNLQCQRRLCWPLRLPKEMLSHGFVYERLPSVQLADVDVHRRHDAGLTGDELSPSRRLSCWWRESSFPNRPERFQTILRTLLWWWHLKPPHALFLWNVVSYPPTGRRSPGARGGGIGSQNKHTLDCVTLEWWKLPFWEFRRSFQFGTCFSRYGRDARGFVWLRLNFRRIPASSLMISVRRHILAKYDKRNG